MILSHALRAAKKPIEYINYSIAQATGASVTCSVPSGTNTGDFLVAVANQTGSTTVYTMTPPSGWTEVLDTLGYFVGYVSSYDGTTSNYTFTKSNAAANPQVIMLAFKNADFDVMGAVSATASNPVAPAITLSSNNSTVIACFVNLSATYPNTRSYSTPTDYTEAFDSDNSLALSYRNNMPAGSSGTVTATATSGALNRAFLIGLKPK